MFSDEIHKRVTALAGPYDPGMVSLRDADVSPRKDLTMQREGRIIRAEEVVRE